MTTFPSIQTPTSISRSPFKGRLKGDFEAGYVQIVPKHTRSRKRFILSWSGMPFSDLLTLEQFFEDNVGNTFDWTHPPMPGHPSGTTYTVMFANETMSFDYVENSIDLFSGQIELEEL